MRFSKLFMATCLASSLLFSGSSFAQQESDYDVLNISVLAKGSTVQFWKAVEIGAKEAAIVYNVNINFQGPKIESDAIQQAALLEAMIEQKPDAICLASVDSPEITEVVKKVLENKIPLIGFDSGIPNAPEGAVVATAATDNYAAGELAAENTYELIKDKVNGAKDKVRIGVVAQEATSLSVVGRTKGFIDTMVRLCGGDKVVAVEGHESFKRDEPNAKIIIEVGVPAKIDEATGIALASSILEKADTIAVYGSNEFAINCIIDANAKLNKLGPDQVIAVGFDAGAKQLDAIAQGIVAGSVTQNPVQIGFQAIRIAVDHIEGKETKDVDTGALWYNSETLTDPQIADCLYR